MHDVKPEHIEKRFKSFLAYKDQTPGDSETKWKETLRYAAEAYEWMREDREFWKYLVSRHAPAEHTFWSDTLLNEKILFYSCSNIPPIFPP